MPVRWRWTVLLLAVFAAAHLCAAATSEYRVKAAFIYKFATYITWPPSPGTTSTTPFLIGILGEDPFGPAFSEVIRNQTVNGRTIQVKQLSRLEDAVTCDVVFIAGSERSELPQILNTLRNAPVLTVSDLDEFAEQGGMIGLVNTEDNHVRFDINKGALERTGLRASSQLLHLARIVDDVRRGRS